jgi:four helix bundle protein
MDRHELQNRLVNFGVIIIKISNDLKRNPAGINLTNQISRSGVAPALNYAEAQDAESRKDFRHKVKIALKELRETLVALQIIYRAGLSKNPSNLSNAIRENNELISIFVATNKSLQL